MSHPMTAAADPTKAHPDPRERKIDFDLNKVDYDWIEKNSDVKELKSAYKALELDGYFHDLLRACGERIVSLDPKFRRVVEGEKKLSADDFKALNDDLFSFIDNMNATDKILSDKHGEDKENRMIFGNGAQP